MIGGRNGAGGVRSAFHGFNRLLHNTHTRALLHRAGVASPTTPPSFRVAKRPFHRSTRTRAMRATTMDRLSLLDAFFCPFRPHQSLSSSARDWRSATGERHCYAYAAFLRATTPPRFTNRRDRTAASTGITSLLIELIPSMKTCLEKGSRFENPNLSHHDSRYSLGTTAALVSASHRYNAYRNVSDAKNPTQCRPWMSARRQ
ncbi:uncharacterized protein LY79DRAFT_403554 [Colletotrichum navitas]|uniref:Uncharacterized protein n=1 Tax=Colletotrichum navitas TaxID=681940 RepID=A0AAD8Q731_9PEZI|nr:uncharacterized protein LY79DRAFT_403554 [Colletotrichum navitas]KAK1597060.1 hypothetical protein LY79DRAFT_403554 [Colletotrichum navitas]